jgi:hypothetical protein
MGIPPGHPALIGAVFLCFVAIELLDWFPAIQTGTGVRQLGVPSDMGIHGIG